MSQVTRQQESNNELEVLSHRRNALEQNIGFLAAWSSDVQLASSPDDDLVGREVIEIPWIGRVVARPLSIGIVVEHRIQPEIVEIRKRKARASVKESVGRKIVEEDAAVSIIGIKPILVAHVEVVDEVRVTEISVIAKRRPVGKLKIINAVAQ